MKFQCPICKKLFKSQRTYRQHELRTRACPRTDNIAIQPWIVDDDNMEQSDSTIQDHASDELIDPCIFGNELIEPMIADLTSDQIASLMRYPEDAITQDLPNLIFFNLDYPCNHSMSWSDTLCVFSPKTTRLGGKWRRYNDHIGLLKVVGLHMRKVIDKDYGGASCLERGLVMEYLKAIDAGKDVVISEFCPYYAKVDGGVIQIQRMVDRLLDTIKANCKLHKDDWVRTKPYAFENLDE